MSGGVVRGEFSGEFIRGRVCPGPRVSPGSLSDGVIPGQVCPGGGVGKFVQRVTSGDVCPGVCPGEFVRGVCPDEDCPGEFLRGEVVDETVTSQNSWYMSSTGSSVLSSSCTGLETGERG